MKTVFLAFLSANLFLACQNSNTNTTADEANEPMEQQPDAVTSGEQKHCFVRLDGDQQQDSTFLQLVIRGETVSGTYNHIPYEKDARRGTVLGTVDNDTLDLVWTFQQEGTQDTMRVVFLFDDEKLMRKSLSVDTQTGRQVTLDSSTFSEAYERIDCLQ